MDTFRVVYLHGLGSGVLVGSRSGFKVSLDPDPVSVPGSSFSIRIRISYRQKYAKNSHDRGVSIRDPLFHGSGLGQS